jgi:hypothetical protein
MHTSVDTLCQRYEKDGWCTDAVCNPHVGCIYVGNNQKCPLGECGKDPTCNYTLGEIPICHYTLDQTLCQLPTPTLCVETTCEYDPPYDQCGDPALDVVPLCHQTPLNCTDDISCTIDTCLGGTCVHLPSSLLCPLPPGNECEVAVCDPVYGCSYMDDDSLCNDTIACTQNKCVEGKCVFTADDSACPIPTGSTCATGKCVVGHGCEYAYNDDMCIDTILCSADACDHQSGMCVHTPNNDMCGGMVGCALGICDVELGCVTLLNQTKCVDNFQCTNDICAQDGQCIHAPMDERCPPPSDTTCVIGTCSPSVGCVYEESNRLCDDQIACSVDICQNGTCHNDPDDSLCTTNIVLECMTMVCDVLQGGCIPIYHDELCADAWNCTIDTCVGGSCVHAPTDALCDALNTECGVYTCSQQNGCVATYHDDFCIDDVPCTIDSCIGGICAHEEDDSLCQGNTQCGSQRCDHNLGCVSVEHQEWCLDSIPCTIDVCAEGMCRNIPNDTLCSSLNTECVQYQCSPTIGCIPVPQPWKCNDGTKTKKILLQSIKKKIKPHNRYWMYN